MLNIWRNLDWSILINAAVSVIPALICITLHECAHGYTALLLGDTTAKDMGRLSLNPLKHFDIMGFVMMAFAGFGWAKPVPIDMRRFRDPKRGMAITAAAGPLTNLVIALVFLFLYGLMVPLVHGTVGYYAALMTFRTATLSLGLAVFNVLPIPPLDGSKVLYSVISDRAYYKLMRYERYGMILLFALVLTGVLSKPLNIVLNFLLDKLAFAADLGLRLGSLIAGPAKGW